MIKVIFEVNVILKMIEHKNYLIFQPIQNYFKKIVNTVYISAWKSNELSEERIKPTVVSTNSLAPGLSYDGNKIRVKFDRGCLKQDKITLLIEKQ